MAIITAAEMKDIATRYNEAQTLAEQTKVTVDYDAMMKQIQNTAAKGGFYTFVELSEAQYKEVKEYLIAFNFTSTLLPTTVSTLASNTLAKSSGMQISTAPISSKKKYIIAWGDESAGTIAQRLYEQSNAK